MSILNSVMNVFKLTGKTIMMNTTITMKNSKMTKMTKGLPGRNYFQAAIKIKTMKIMIPTAGQTIKSL